MGLVLLPTPAIATCKADLGPALEAIAAAPALQSARLGMLVETEGGEEIYSRDADHFFVPASNVKLFTTAAALDVLGPDYRIRTSIYGQPTAADQPLVVVGRGDPSLGLPQLQQLSAQIQPQVGRVSRLLGDDSYFPGSPYNANWEWEDVQAGYGAPVNSLILNGNAVDITLTPRQPGQPLGVSWVNPPLAPPWPIENHSRTVAPGSHSGAQIDLLWQPSLRVRGQLAADSPPKTWSLAIPTPGDYFLQQLAAQLEQIGVAVGPIAVTTTPIPIRQPLAQLAAVESPPLDQLLVIANQDSDNLYAEALLKTLGKHLHPQALDATAAGLDAIATTLARLGVSPDSFELVDGSGIARQNLATPRALVSTLQAMDHHPYRQAYQDSLAVAGVSGTLRNRLRGAPAVNLRGKSGALTGNVSLSGYLSPPHYEPLIVSILINHSDRHANHLRQLIDQMLVEIAQLRQC